MAQIQEIRIMFDTNVLFTGTSHKLINDKAHEYISANHSRQDLQLSFYIPSVVIEERRYQMTEKGTELLGPVGKLEQLLGHQLGINSDILRSRVDDAIKKEIEANRINTFEVDCSKIDWNRAISLATGRRPPFEKGEKEKGFRDFIIAQTFFQLCEGSPVTPKHCRVVLVTADGLLTEYVNGVCSDRTNIKVLDSIESLNSYIETMASTIGEEMLKEVQGKASNIFWNFSSKSGLWNDWNLYEKIQASFKDKITEMPANSTIIEIDSLSLALPRFEKKEKHVIHWVTVLTVKRSAYIIEFPGTGAGSGLLGAIASGQTGSLSSFGSAVKRKTHEGDYTVEIKWRTTLTTRKVIKSPKFDGIAFKEARWSPVDK